MGKVRLIRLLVGPILWFGLSSCTARPQGETRSKMYVDPKKAPHRMENHGDVRVDDYFWMKERDTAPVLDYLRSENRRTDEALASTVGLQEKLYTEMRSRVKEDDSTVPLPYDDYFYYVRFEQGKEYAIHARKKGSLAATEEILLNGNDMAKGFEFFELSSVQPSPDHRYIAFATDTKGRRIYELKFKDTKTGEILKDKIEAVTPNFTWAADSKTVFFVKQDAETLRAHQLYRYEVGSGKAPELVYEEKDTTYIIYVDSSKSDTFVFLNIYRRDSFEVRFLNSKEPKGTFQVFLPREEKHEYNIADGGDRFYVLSNWNAKNFRVFETPLAPTPKDKWKEVIPHSEKVLIEELDVYQDFIFLEEREAGLTQLRVWDRKSGKGKILKFNDPVYEVGGTPLPNYNSKMVRFTYESLNQPPSVYDENIETGVRDLKKIREVPGFDASLYESKRMWATAKDGTRIPISLLQKKGTVANGKNPLLLYGYGSYGYSIPPYFRSGAFSLVDRGFVFAIAHIRGGSEMGRDWYEQGRLKHKMNTFTDFISSAEHLIKEKYTSPEHLYIMGGSAGGLLMGAVINMRPELFKGVVAAVPFVDVMTSMLDESIPLTTGEYVEWGDPRKKDDYFTMRAYSPYDNVEKKAYPNLFVTTGYHDSQVQYWEPAKWVAKLRDYKTDKNLLLFYTELEAGHGGASGRFEAMKMVAKEYAFLLMLEGIKN